MNTQRIDVLDLLQRHDDLLLRTQQLMAERMELLRALRAALPVLLEARERWSSGEDCYTSAEDLALTAIAKACGSVTDIT